MRPGLRVHRGVDGREGSLRFRRPAALPRSLGGDAHDGVHWDQDYRRGCRMTSAGAIIDVDIREIPQKPGLGERQLREVYSPLLQALDQNEKLVNALYEAREQISSLKEEVDKLCAPPSTYGVYLSVNEDATGNILSQGRKVKVNLHPSIKAETLKPGQE